MFSSRRALSLIVALASVWAAASCTTSSSIVGAPCAGPENCDASTYCHAFDDDCGLGECRERPTGHVFAENLACGCDGKVHGSIHLARQHGVDVGNNDRCTPVPGRAWRCGDRALCGTACNPSSILCAPPLCPTPTYLFVDACAQADGFFTCLRYDFHIGSCADPRVLALCNGCIDDACSRNTHQFSSANCSLGDCGEIYIECIE